MYRLSLKLNKNLIKQQKNKRKNCYIFTWQSVSEASESNFVLFTVTKRDTMIIKLVKAKLDCREKIKILFWVFEKSTASDVID